MDMTSSQASKRKDRILKDQHGRGWLCTMDIKIWEPTGEITRTGWSDPLGTPQHLLRLSKDEFGQASAGLVVDYPAWIAMLEEGERDWMRRYRMVGRKLYRDAFVAESPEFLNNESILDSVGPRPWPPLEAVKRAQNGDKSVLIGATLDPETYEPPKPKAKVA